MSRCPLVWFCPVNDSREMAHKVNLAQVKGTAPETVCHHVDTLLYLDSPPKPEGVICR